MNFVDYDTRFAEVLFDTFKDIREEDYELYRRAYLPEIASEWSRQLKGSENAPFNLSVAVSLKVKLLDEAYKYHTLSFSI